MTRAVVNRLLLGLIGLACLAVGLWLFAARCAPHLLPDEAGRYIATRPHRSLAGSAVRTDLLRAVHGWWLPAALMAVCAFAVLFLAWQCAGVRAKTVRLGAAKVDASTLARRIVADTRGLEGVASARASCVDADPLRFRLTVWPSDGAAPADVLSRVCERVVPGLCLACTGTTPRIEVRFVAARSPIAHRSPGRPIHRRLRDRPRRGSL